MKVLILNWRSIKDPWVGGAEWATFEHAKRWVAKNGAEVDWLSPGYNWATSSEKIKGVNFVYAGFPLGRSVLKLLFSFPVFYFLVFWIYLNKYRGKVDVVIDQVHGIPFLTPLYVKEKIVVFVHEVGGKIWDKMYPFPINILGKFLEKVLYVFYRNKTVVTVSNGTKSDLILLGLPENNIKIVYNGVSLQVLGNLPEKYPVATLVFLNRLVRMKGVERALKVFSRIKDKLPESRFIVIGRAEPGYLEEIKSLSMDLGLSDSVEFTGYVHEDRKIELLSKSHVLLNTSYKEGWGLVNLEANACGTPVVAFNVCGNTESVVEAVNGHLIKDGDLDEMARKALEIRNDVELRKSCLEYARKFNWDEKSGEFYSYL